MRTALLLPLTLPLLLVALLAPTPSPLLAQEGASTPTVVIGYVVDQLTGGPVSGVLVELPAQGHRAITDSDGRFAFVGLKPGTYVARVGHLGYEEHTATWTVGTGSMTLTVALGPRPVTLEGVTARAYTFGEQLRDRRRKATVSSQAIERDRLAITGARDGLQALMEGALLSRTPCGLGSGADAICIWSRGQVVRPSVLIDERIASLQELEMYPPRELYAIEVFRGGRQIRAYTVRWVEWEGQRPRTRMLRPLEIW